MKHIRRKVTSEVKLVAVAVRGDLVEVEAFESTNNGPVVSAKQLLAVNEAKELRKALKQAIAAAEANNPF